ncbi:ribosomal-processing cysteine protease Prp [Erysipelothrix sp. HDW6C]|uniref:ribosomal-processing cysteine protease Prp n=1 Tax=Erysipelothrix sp. HDW6C TaxID=2714930 RepID=UPI00140CB219|nr:ribosomal-processing cysteine protease Prp [Erysipelothrix sp. HDW6C]QIK70096.1 ribosomal-processing cysteine protease Prp [Erysipelothrix sp. HDW6C]
MIKVSITKKGDSYQKMRVTGHSGSGEPGFDLVCAGVSSVMTGALNGFDTLDEDSKLVLTQEPLVEIEIIQSNEINQKLFEFVLIQLKTIEAAHANYIKIDEKEVIS